jgi:preprotein translocase subunit YajC
VNGAEISFLVIIGVLIAFYLMIIRPGQQEQTRQQHTIRGLKVGDEVITTAGFFARVKEIHTPEDGPVELLLELSEGVQVRALTSAITRLVPADERAGQRERTEEA